MTAEKQWRCQLLPCIEGLTSDVFQRSKPERVQRQLSSGSAKYVVCSVVLHEVYLKAFVHSVFSEGFLFS
jgi:hypothetical protein